LHGRWLAVGAPVVTLSIFNDGLARRSVSGAAGAPERQTACTGWPNRWGDQLRLALPCPWGSISSSHQRAPGKPLSRARSWSTSSTPCCTHPCATLVSRAHRCGACIGGFQEKGSSCWVMCVTDTAVLVLNGGRRVCLVTPASVCSWRDSRA